MWLATLPTKAGAEDARLTLANFEELDSVFSMLAGTWSPMNHLQVMLGVTTPVVFNLTLMQGEGLVLPLPPHVELRLRLLGNYT